MAEQRIFDPSLGEDRDAFPGEVVPPEQEKTLQKLMREEEQRFTSDLAEVKATGKLTPSDEDAVRRFAKLRAEVKRQEYIDALKSNPANILQNLLIESLKDNEKLSSRALSSLNSEVTDLQKFVSVEKSSEIMKTSQQGTPLSTEQLLRRRRSLPNLVFLSISGFENDPLIAAKASFELLKALGFIPLDSLTSLRDLYNATKAAGNQKGSDKPYLDENTIRNLSSNKPGMEGIKASITAEKPDNTPNNSRPFSKVEYLFINASAEAAARIIDRGYTPYRDQRT